MSVMSISEWFEGRSVLVTGATGFMGKVLVEKLLRSCTGIQAVYILIRPKRGSDHSQRLEDFINCMIFDKIRDTNPNQLSKIIAIRGDVTLPDLGLNEEDANILRKNVTVVFHCAANVRFDQKLKSAVNLNTGGALRLLNLLTTFEHVDAFVHVSTAYCQCGVDILEEKTYETAHPPRGVLDTTGWMPADALDVITPYLLDKQPNTYAYTKCLTEGLVTEFASKFPIAICRPSIVTAAWKEPFPGWVENLNGPTGLMVGAGKGVIRSMHCKEDYLADCVPVDIAINAIIASAWHIGITRPEKIYVCNVTESGTNPATWGYALETARKHYYNNPFSIALWYPDGSIKASKFHHDVCVVFLHYLPAYLIDFLLLLARRKPFMVRTQDRIQSGLAVLQYYTTKEWIFVNDNMKALRKSLSEEDHKTFYMDMKELVWEDYLLDYLLGAREYCLKEDPSTLPYARKMLRRLYLLDCVKNALLALALLYLIYNYFMYFIYGLDSAFQGVKSLLL